VVGLGRKSPPQTAAWRFLSVYQELKVDCPNCQTPNPEDHNFCSHCGTLLTSNCPRCNFEVTKEADFCGNCGLGLTPKAQFLWGQGWEALPRPRPDQPGHRPAVEGSESPAAVEARPQIPASPPSLSQYIPKELMSKLEAARQRGEMVGERRIVTTLFCDVKGSTAAAEQLDPEDWTEIINGAFEYMIKPVYKYEGTLARLMGDAILAFFGAPIAHEDDPQRAVLTGLEIVSGMAPYREKIRRRWGIDFNVRVGINTGLVVVGAVGSDLRMEYTAMGDAINLAARMEQTAAPGSVQIAHDTYKLVAPLFEIEELGGIQVKGKEEPVPAYRVLGHKPEAGTLRGIEGLEAELVGRSQELLRLQEAVANLERGIGGIVCLMGGAGLGKSRLVQELKGTDGGSPDVIWVETASLSYEISFPYALFQRLTRRLNGIASGDDGDPFWAKIETLTHPLPSEQAARFKRVFATLFGLPDPAGRPRLEGEHFRRELYAAMESMWQTRFADRPTVLVLEDLHWADPASIALLLHLLPTVEKNPLVLLCTFRPDRDAPVYQLKGAADADYHHRYTEINLRPLSEGQSNELVNRLLAIAELPDELRARILERAGGNPFFIEEVVRTLIENGAVVAEERSENGTLRRYWRAMSTAVVIDIPQSLQGLLAARIDRLEEGARHVVQLASVIGRTFYGRVLAELGQEDGLPLGTVEAQIDRLVRLEMIQEAARVPEVEYKFRNPLTQEIAYQTILHKRRREFHKRVGAALERLFPERLAELAPRLAFHFAEGHQADKALAYYSMAGDNAFRLFALEEALANYQHALEWAEPAKAGNEVLIHLYRRRGRTLELLLRIGEALETYQALEALGERRGDDALRLAGMSAQGTVALSSGGSSTDGRQRAEEALALARELGDRAIEARSLWCLLLASRWVDSAQALSYGEEGLAIARELADRPDASPEDLEQLALLLLDLSYPLINAGQIELERERAAEARQLFERLGNLPMASTATQRLALAFRAEGKYEQVEATLEKSIAMDKSIGNEGGLIGSAFGLLDIYPSVGDLAAFFAVLDEIRPVLSRDRRYPEAISDLFGVLAYYHLGAIDPIRRLSEALLRFAESDFPMWPQIFISFAARAYIRAGDLASTAQMFEKLGTGVDMENLLFHRVPNIVQIRAELALADGELDQALADTDQFLKKVRQKGMLAYVPEKLLLKGRILREAKRPEEAYAVLKEAHALATEQNARSVLWQICFQLAELEAESGNSAESQRLMEQAREAIDFIAEHAGREELRASFLAMPEVHMVLER
jgi:class 3 adenylate cyclase/tetratricopeptide (TPR) repeat protein